MFSRGKTIMLGRSKLYYAYFFVDDTLLAKTRDISSSLSYLPILLGEGI